MINNYLARHKKNKGYPKETSPKQIEDLKKRLDNARAMTGENKKGVYYGDSELDLNVAESFGLDFVFVKGYTDWHDWAPLINSKGYIVIDDFCQKNTDYLSGNRF